MSRIVKTTCQQSGLFTCEVFSLAASQSRKLRCWLQCLLLAILFSLCLNVPAQDSSIPFVVKGIAVNEGGEPAPAMALDFWLDQKKLGSTVSDDNGAYEIELAVGALEADALIRVTSDNGHASLTVADASSGASELRLIADSEATGMPVWLRAFFSTILPIVVLAIVFLAIRNRKRKSSDA